MIRGFRRAHTLPIKVTIDIPKAYVAAIDAACRSAGLTREALCRQAVISHLGELARRDRQQAFGIWKDRQKGKVHAPSDETAW